MNVAGPVKQRRIFLLRATFPSGLLPSALIRDPSDPTKSMRVVVRSIIVRRMSLHPYRLSKFSILRYFVFFENNARRFQVGERFLIFWAIH